MLHLLGLEPGLPRIRIQNSASRPEGEWRALVVAKENSGSVQGKRADGARLHLACSHRGAESYAAEHWGQWGQRFLGSIGPGWTVGGFPVTCRCQELLLPFSVVTAVAAFCYTCLKLQDTDNISSSVQVFGITPGKLPNFRPHSENSESTRVKSMRVCSLMLLIYWVALVPHTRDLIF